MGFWLRLNASECVRWLPMALPIASRSQLGLEERNWWKPLKGAGQRDVDPFYNQVHARMLS